MGISTMRSILVVFAIAVTAFAVTEVQELGNADASTSLAKEEGNADGSTSEANLAPQDEDEDDDVGEATGRRGGGGFLSTTGSFTLSSNRGGNSETLLGDITEHDAVPDDLAELVFRDSGHEPEAHGLVTKTFAKRKQGKKGGGEEGSSSTTLGQSAEALERKKSVENTQSS